MRRRTTTAVIAAATLLTAAPAAGAADKVKRINHLVPVTCGSTQGQTPRAGSDLLVLKGPFTAGTTRKGTVKQDTPLHYSPVTKHYRVTVKRGRKGKLAVKLHVNFSFQSLGYTAFGDPRLEGWVCRADGSFSTR